MTLHSCEGNPAVHYSTIDNFRGKRERRDGEVSAPSRYFIEAYMPGRVEDGESYPRDHFIGLESRRINALKEIGSRDNALATLRHRRDFRIKTDRASRKFGRGIRERQAPAERSTIANRGMSHVGQGMNQQRVRRRQQWRMQCIVMPDPAADDDSIVALSDRIEIRNIVDINEDRGLCHAKIEHGHQALTTRKDRGVRSIFCQERQGLA
jgi:hypothetical protein